MSSNLFQLHNANKSFGTKVIFKSETFSINDGEHVGVIGPNGAGKTTLLKIICGLEVLDSGNVIKSRSIKLGYLQQEVEWSSDQTLENYLSDCLLPVWELKNIAKKLALSEEMFNKPISTLSGGFRMRAKLLHLLGEEPNLLLLDEPTNYLDLETLLAFEKFLQDYNKSFLIISHDREFLKKTTNYTLEIEGGEVSKYPGNVDEYFTYKNQIREELKKRSHTLEQKRKEILDFAARFGFKATKARQVQSRLKLMNKMEKIEIKPLHSVAKVKIPDPIKTGKEVVNVKNLELGYDGKVVLSNVDLNLRSGDHLAIVGFNGAGKSTLLKGLAGILKPKKGEIKYGLNVNIGYYAQHVFEELTVSNTVYKELKISAHVNILDQEIKDIAGSLLFSGNDIDKKVSVLSGGEKARLALGKILLKKVPLLLLDEVTNHLDFYTNEALTQALSEYKGSIIVVSHDRCFVKRVANKILEIRNGNLILYPGNYDEYLWSLEQGALSEIINIDTISGKSEKHVEKKIEKNTEVKQFNYKEQKKLIERQIRKHEKEASRFENKILEIYSEIEKLNKELESARGDEFDEIGKNLNSCQLTLSDLESQWDLLIEQKKLEEENLENLKKLSVS